jgi:signal transduction histidine kinase/CheY-like chemotaxis protein
MSTPPPLPDHRLEPAAQPSEFAALVGPLFSEESAAHNLDETLAALARAFASEAAGVYGVLNDSPVLARAVRADGAWELPPRFPWEGKPDLLHQLCEARSAIATGISSGQTILAAATTLQEESTAVLWLRAKPDRDWSIAEKGGLLLALLAFMRRLTVPSDTAAWAPWLEQVRRRRGLEATARVVSRLSHDFSNVLTGILGFTELSLGQLSRDGAPKHYLNEVYQAAQQGTKLVGHLSQLSRRGPQPATPTALAPLIAEELARVREAWSQSIRLEAFVSTNLPPVAVSAEALRQVLGRLLDNACEAIAGTGIVTVSARTTQLGPEECVALLGDPSAGEQVEVSIRDTGSGWTSEARRRVLAEPFYTTKPRHKGYGLSLVYALLRNHHGGLRLDSASAGGTTVRFYLPLATASLPSRRQAAPAAPCGERLLVVDDDPITLHLMCTTLEGAGYRVQPAMDGDQALASYTAEGEPFRLVLSDVVMPRMSGVDLARRLLDRDPQVNLLFTSGHALSGSLPEGADGRRFDLLPKPFRPDGLLQAVRIALASTDRVAAGPGAWSAKLV